MMGEVGPELNKQDAMSCGVISISDSRESPRLQANVGEKHRKPGVCEVVWMPLFGAEDPNSRGFHNHPAS